VLGLGLGLALAGAACIANAAERGTTGADFLKIGPGAAATGVGEAYTARFGDALSMFYNPAGLADVDMNRVTAMHLNWIAETQYETLACASPILGIGTLGAGLMFLHMPEIPALDENAVSVGTAQVYDLGVMLSFARDLTVFSGVKGLSGGVNLKFLQRELAGSKALGLAGDLGALYHLNENISFGLSCSNLGYLSKFEASDESLPVLIRLGGAYSQTFAERHRVALMADAIQPLDNSVRANFGLEYGLDRWLSLRVGYKAGYDTDGLQAGAGLQWQNLSFDYAVKFMGVFGPTHYVSASAGFGASLNELQNDRAQEF